MTGGNGQLEPAIQDDVVQLSSLSRDYGSLPAETRKTSSAGVNLWFNYSSDIAMTNGKSHAKVRSHPRSENGHAKHRRTRSGCFTCRARRVKCDELRPVCDRCRKGSRECEYPQPRSKSVSKLGQRRTSKQNSGSSSDEYDDEEVKAETLPSKEQQSIIQVRTPISTSEEVRSIHGSIASELAGNSSFQCNQWPAEQRGRIPLANTSLSIGDSDTITKSRTASASPGHLQTSPSVLSEGSLDGSQWSRLPLDHQAHLTYHQNYLTSHHYFFKHEANFFIHHTLLEHALSYEPLRFAVVGFAAFHSALQNNDSNIQNFLCYYNSAIKLLRRSLANGDKYTNATLMTILQLATFEEYLGDWINVLGHQKAAYAMLIELYNVNSIMNVEVGRKILAWYSRLDLFAGLMSGYETVLGREWFCANESYYQVQSRKNPSNIDCKIEAAISSYRVLAMDMAWLFAKLPRGEISVGDFVKKNNLITERLRMWRQDLDPLIANERYLVESFDVPFEKDLEDIVDPYLRHGLYKGALWTINFMLMDWIALDIMHKYQTAIMLKQPSPPELGRMALELCRLFEAVEYWAEGPPGSVLRAQAGLSIAALFLPRDRKHAMWCRRKMAMIEGKGYILAPSVRNKLAELWNIPDVVSWWLPEGEGFSPVIRSIRSIVENRTPPSTNSPKAEDVRTVKALVATMSVSGGQGDAIP